MPEKPHKCSFDMSMAGRMAWVIQNLANLRGNGEQDAVRWVIDRWIDGEGHEYLEGYGINLKDYSAEDTHVLPISGATHKKRG